MYFKPLISVQIHHGLSSCCHEKCKWH